MVKHWFLKPAHFNHKLIRCDSIQYHKMIIHLSTSRSVTLFEILHCLQRSAVSTLNNSSLVAPKSLRIFVSPLVISIRKLSLVASWVRRGSSSLKYRLINHPLILRGYILYLHGRGPIERRHYVPSLSLGRMAKKRRCGKERERGFKVKRRWYVSIHTSRFLTLSYLIASTL